VHYELHCHHYRQCGTYVKIDNDCACDYDITFIVNWQPKAGWRQSHKYKQVQASRPVHNPEWLIEGCGPIIRNNQQGDCTARCFSKWWLAGLYMDADTYIKLNGSPRLRLYNEKSDVICFYYSLTHHSRSTSSTMYCVVCNLNVSTRTLRPTTIAKIRLRTDCCNAFPQFFKVWVEAKVPGNERSMEWKFLGHSLLMSESSTGAKVPWSESSWTFCSTGTKVQRNEKSRYRHRRIMMITVYVIRNHLI